MKIFITGGSGFVGRNLIRTATARGDEPRALARSTKAAKTVEALGATAVSGSLDDITPALLEGCETVIHAAAKVDEWGPRADYQRINVEGTRRLLEAARVAGVTCFVLIGTEAAYADGGAMTDIDDDRPLPKRPLPRYPATKAAAEQLVRAADTPGFRTVAVRPRLIWGRDDSSVLPQLVRAANAGRFTWVNGGHYLTSTCHVANVCEGVWRAIEKGRGGESYFLTDGAPLEFRYFATRLLATRGISPTDKSVPRALARWVATGTEKAWEWLPLPGNPPVTRVACALGGQEVTVRDDKARHELGYAGKISIEAGLAELASGEWTA